MKDFGPQYLPFERARVYADNFVYLDPGPDWFVAYREAKSRLFPPIDGFQKILLTKDWVFLM